jgi:septal ring factor EnvC (AmiA/AmiB activator)
MLRIVTLSLGVIVAVLLCAIGVVAASKSHLSSANTKPVLTEPIRAAEPEKARVEAEKKAAADRKRAETRIAALEDENSELKVQVKTSATSSAEQSKKLAIAIDEAVRLRKELEAARAETVELNKKYDRVETELNESLAKQIEAPANADEKPPIVKVEPNKATVARAKVNRAHHRNYNTYHHSSSPDLPSYRARDPGVGPRLGQKSGDSYSASDQ